MSESSPLLSCIVVLHERVCAEPGLLENATSLARVIAARVVVIRVKRKTRAHSDNTQGEAELEGDLASAISHVSSHWRPVLIMFSGNEPAAAAVMNMGSKLAAPLLVWREGCSGARILAASDLQHPQFPVLRGGSDLGAWLQAPLLALHNVTQLSDVLFPPTPCSVSFALEDAMRAQSDVLTAALKSLEITAGSIVSFHYSTASAIAETARREHADTIVVGRRQRPWWKRGFSHSVAAELVTAAEHSVLVIPM